MLKTLVTCCCPSEEDRDEDQSDESTRLLRNGTSHGGNRWGNSGAYQAPGSGGGRDQRNGPAPTPADDEQAILARILQDTANNVIDVSTTDAHTVEPREYMERARKYNQQLSSQITAATLQTATAGSGTVTVGSAGKRSSGGGFMSSSGSGSGVAANRCLLSDPSLTSSGSGTSSSSDKVLSAPPLCHDDLAMIKQLSSQIARVVTDIRVEHKEDLVVQFAPS